LVNAACQHILSPSATRTKARTTLLETDEDSCRKIGPRQSTWWLNRLSSVWRRRVISNLTPRISRALFASAAAGGYVPFKADIG
jgi:hypothetical protein